MRLKATRRPPASHTATLIRMFSSLALARAPCTIVLASASVNAMSTLSSRGLFRGGATVDDELAARHVGRFVGRQVEHAVGDFLRRAHASHGQAAESLLPGRTTLEQILDHVGGDRAGVHG